MTDLDPEESFAMQSLEQVIKDASWQAYSIKNRGRAHIVLADAVRAWLLSDSSIETMARAEWAVSNNEYSAPWEELHPVIIQAMFDRKRAAVSALFSTPAEEQ